MIKLAIAMKTAPSPRRRGRPATFDRSAALDAAVALFWRHGYDGTSIAMLTDAMGVTPPTLYSAFGSKEQLYGEALVRYLHHEHTVTGPLWAEQRGARAMLEAYLRAIARRLSAPESGRGCMISIGSVQLSPDAAPAATAAAAMRREGFAQIVAMLERAKSSGELPESADATALARFVLAIVQGIAVQAADGATARQLDAMITVALAAWPSDTAPTAQATRARKRA